ncbi:hypothetical protein, partial [Sulfurirhabdus autotrophica]
RIKVSFYAVFYFNNWRGFIMIRNIKKILVMVAMMAWVPFAFAMSPYIKGNSLAAGDINSVMSQAETKLKAAGFNVIGAYQPKGISDSGVVVVTDKAILDTIAKIGGDVIVGAGIRVGVKSDGTLSYMNPEYWYRAYFRKNYDANQAPVKALQAHLKEALGAGEQFGGEVDQASLAKYHYMFGMEYFDDNRDLVAHESFEKAVETIRTNLAKGAGNATKVYEVIMPEKKIAVFGVAMNDQKTGDGVWVNKIEGSDNIAALPYEVFVVGNQTQALYARYRIALGWSSLKMTSFGKIMATPGNIKSTLKTVAGIE